MSSPLVPTYDDVMAVVADAGGHGALLQAIALDVACRCGGCSMTPDDGDLQNVIVHVDTVGVAAVGGGDSPLTIPMTAWAAVGKSAAVSGPRGRCRGRG